MSSDTIIASVDLGPTTPEVILAAVAESGPGGTVLVTHCLPDLQAIRPLFPERGADDLTRSMGIEDAVRRHLEELIKSLQLERVEVVLGMGQPYAAVTQLASDRSARLIVVGSPSDPSAWFAGTALRIARYAECPVLLHRTAPSGPIVAATDLSDSSLPALAAGEALAMRRGARLVAIHVLDVDHTLQSLAFAASMALSNIPLSVDRSALVRAAQASLDSAVQLKAPSATAELSWGNPAEVVVGRARELGASAIVVATRGRTGLDRVLVGSVAERVAQSAPCSVLVARHVDPG